MQNRNEYHESRLATTDEHGHRVTLYPEDISGIWKKRRKIIYAILIGIYLILPWIYINGKQIILLNLPKREFYIFGMTFYGHDGPLIIFLLLGFVLLIAFVTSVWGRVWCGWACPQTVFIDSIYRFIDRMVEGNARARRKLDESPMSAIKFFKKALKWLLYIVVSLHIVHSFLGYFVGTHHLIEISLQSPFKNIELFILMLILTGIILFDFGWFREQFCVIACPYGRMQSVFMDESSYVVGYDYNRGEPRRGSAQEKSDEGDCINCYRCVKACPTGIDIRRGTQQLECINCTMCIDACDEIMEKLHKPKGLISYTSENILEGKPNKRSFRTYIYILGVFLVIGGLFITVSRRFEVHSKLLRVPGEPYTVVENDEYEYLNRYTARQHYYGSEKLIIDYQVAKEFKDLATIVSPILPKELVNNEELFLFIKFKKDLLNNGSAVLIIDELLYKGDKLIKTNKKEVKIVGPLN
mgnify:CR=1 FL=1|tara:strand:- start:12467 stop:13873 length:1407 start_codon:yes stop_codon:yes gene_type:complete